MAGKKGPNFTELEKCILVELIGSRREIIEGKGSDAKMIEKKNKEWDDLAAEFNSRRGVQQRTVTQLRSLWKNLKSKTKSDVAKERSKRSKTGGGLPEQSTDKISSAVREIIPQQIHSCENAYDDDAELHRDIVKNSLELDPTTSLECSSNTITATATVTPSMSPIQSVSSMSPPQSSSSNKTSFSSGLNSKTSSDKDIIREKSAYQDDVKQKMLQMAEREHELKMEVLQLKKEYIQMKKKKIDWRVYM